MLLIVETLVRIAIVIDQVEAPGFAVTALRRTPPVTVAAQTVETTNVAAATARET